MMPRFSFLLRLFLVSALLSPGGCQWSRGSKPLTPSQLLSSERSQAGIAALEREDFEEAEKRLSEAVRLNKKDIAHRRNYAEALWKRGKQIEALQQLDEAVRRGGEDDASLHISLSEKNLSMNRLSAAFHHADHAVRLNPNESKSWALRAMAGWRLAMQQRNDLAGQRFTEAVEQAKNDFYRALSLSPENRDILPELAAIQMACGQPEHALATWQKYRSGFLPGSEPVELFQGTAESFIALRRYDEAMSCLLEARKREPESGEIEQRILEVVAMTQNRVF